MNSAKKQNLINNMKLIGVVLVIAFFIATVIVLASDNSRAGGYMAAASVAIISAMICVSVISAHRKARRQLRYGYNSNVSLPTFMLPDDSEKLTAAAALLLGGEAGECDSGNMLIGMLRKRGSLVTLDRKYGLTELLGGLNDALASMPEKPGLVLTKEMIVSLDNPFVANRRADGEDTAPFDLSTAAYLLRAAYVEPVLMFALTPRAQDGENPNAGGHFNSFDTGRLNIALVPTGKMHALHDMLKEPGQG